jgi:hypothetical protein
LERTNHACPHPGFEGEGKKKKKCQILIPKSKKKRNVFFYPEYGGSICKISLRCLKHKFITKFSGCPS